VYHQEIVKGSLKTFFHAFTPRNREGEKINREGNWDKTARRIAKQLKKKKKFFFNCWRYK